MTVVACRGKEAPPAATAPKTYEVATVTPRATTLYIDVPATVTGQQNVEIRPMIEGYIEKIFVDEGAWVTAGQKLFQIKLRRSTSKRCAPRRPASRPPRPR